VGTLEIKKIAVLGAGLMGHGIAQVAAQAGFEVSLRDVADKFLENGLNMIKKSLQKFVEKGKISEKEKENVLGRIHSTLDLKEAVADADLIIEAVPEKVQLKKDMYMEVDKFCPEHAIIASNTSSMSITGLASAIKRPERFCGMHWFNPAQLMRLIEVVQGVRTSDETIEAVVEVSKKMGKEPIVVRKDVAGFVVNRIMDAALNEALFLVWRGVVTIEDVDKAVTLGLNWPMGPLRLLDYIGLDTSLEIFETLYAESGDPKFMPCPLLKHMVRAGLLGRKTGKGFYEWK
jgi:3-hydroxybutyryl-CoA dehydrogenase